MTVMNLTQLLIQTAVTFVAASVGAVLGAFSPAGRRRSNTFRSCALPLMPISCGASQGSEGRRATRCVMNGA